MIKCLNTSILKVQSLALLIFFVITQCGVAFAQANQFVTDASGRLVPVATLEEELERAEEGAVNLLDPPFDLRDPSANFLDNQPLTRAEDDSDSSTVEANSDDPFSGSAGTWGQGYSDLWWLNRVRAEEGWAFTRGNGVTVAVIDSGLDIDHPDIADNVFKNEAELNGVAGFDDDGNGYIDDVNGWDFVFNDNDPNDFNGHGTHVAGIIGAVADNMVGIAGVAPGASILPLRVLNSAGGGFFSDIFDAIRYAADMGAQVINMSLGGLKSLATSEELDLLDQAVQYAIGKGSILVAAAGNDTDPVSDHIPASTDGVIAVGATNPVTDSIAFFSNFGPELDLVAPGVDILSLKSGETFCSLCVNYPHLIVQDDYLRLPGTSMSSPMVAGAVALMRAYQPFLTLEDIERRLRYSSEDLGVPGRDDTYGAGLLDVFEAISTDYYATGEIKTRWLAEADAENVVKLDYDLMGRIARKNFADGGYADLTYWSGTANRFEQIFYDASGVWQKTEEYWADGVTLHFVRYADGTVEEYDENGNLLSGGFATINFNNFAIHQVQGQNGDDLQYEIKDSGATFRMYGNNWKAIQLNAAISADTILKFDFRSTGVQSEINGIAFSPNLSFHSAQSRLIQIDGTQAWGAHQGFQYTGAGDWQSFEIPVGQLFTGNFPFMMFLNDADAGQATNIEYRNVSIGSPQTVTPPNIDPVPEFTNQTDLTLNGTKSPGTSIWINGVEVVPLDGSSLWSYSTTLGSEALHTFTATAKDGDGNESLETQVETTLDQTLPTGTVVIDSGAAVTNDLLVNLSLTQTELNPDEMRVFVEGNDVTGWIDFQSTYSVSLPSGDGLKEVRVEYQDKAGNVSIDVISDTITLEEQAVGDVLNFNDFTIHQVIGQSGDNHQYEILDGGSTFRMYGNNWKAIWLNEPITSDTVLKFDFRSTGVEGEINGIAFSPDLNFHNSQSRLVQIFGTQIWGAHQGFQYTNVGDWQSFEIPIGQLFTGTLPYMMFVNDADAGQASDVQFRNVSVSSPVLVEPPVVDPVVPYTNQSNITISGSKPSDTGIWFNGTEIISPNADTTWSVPLILVNEATHTLSITTKDVEGNESTPVVVKVTLDETLPTGTVVIDGGAAITQDLLVNLTLNQTELNPDKMRIFVEGVDVTGWINFQSSYDVSLPTGDGVKEVRVEYQDKAGNVSTDIISDTITLEEQVGANVLNFNDFTIHQVQGQNGDDHQYEILDGGVTFRMFGNNWKAIWVNQPITSDTVLKFEFRSTGDEAEINGIAFSPNLGFHNSQSRLFQIFGTQSWGAHQDFQYTNVGGWQSFEIPVGQFFTGGFLPYLMFVNDADAGQATSVEYRNISIE